MKPGLLISLFITLIAMLLTLKASGQKASELVTNASEFLKTLNSKEKAIVKFDFSDPQRQTWTNLPVGLVPRPGIQYGHLSDSSRIAFHKMLSTLLSSQGYLKVTSIMQLDDILNSLIQSEFDAGKMSAEQLNELKNLKWAHDNYYIAIFGEPQNKDPWGLNFGGHHISINLTVMGESISFSPLFLGTDPAEIKSAKYAGWRVLSKEEDYGFLLLNFLTETQKAKAILNQAVPQDIITNPKGSQRITEYHGVSVKTFSADQKVVLEMLIQEYTHNFEHETAHRLYEKILSAGLDKIYFAWIGSPKPNKPHYYVVHGPDFLIEYDNYQGNGNHIHIILREDGNNFGEDILKAHYENSLHHKN